MSRPRSRPAIVPFRPRLLLLLSCSLVLAGCVGAGPQESAANDEWLLDGTFAEGATLAEVEEARVHLRPTGAEVLVADGPAAQFQVRPLDAQECEQARAWLEARAYVDAVSDCQPLRDPAEAERGLQDPWWVPDEDGGRRVDPTA